MPTGIDNLAKLGQDLKSATESKRFFGTLTQWVASFLRLAPFAVAAGHLSLPLVLAHFNKLAGPGGPRAEPGKSGPGKDEIAMGLPLAFSKSAWASWPLSWLLPGYQLGVGP